MKLDVRTNRLREGELIPIYYDFMFTTIFNNPNNMDLLERFLSAFLDIPIEDIRGNIKINSRDLLINNKKEKNKKIDLLVDYKGDKINVEINTEHESMGIKERNVVYICKTHSKQLYYKDKDYRNIKKSMQLNFNTNIRNNHDYIEKYYFRNEYGEILTENFEIDMIDIEKGSKIWYDGFSDIKAGWCALLKINDKHKFAEMSEKIMNNEEAKKLTDEMEMLSDDDDCLEMYGELTEAERVRNTLVGEAEDRGIKQGIEQNKKETAINLYNIGVEKEKICQGLNITEEQLEKYLKDSR